jgi:6-phosphogluconolactonase
MEIEVLNNPNDTLVNLAAYFVTQAEHYISHNGKFSVALSGGSSPKKLYELLASDDYKNKVDWDNVYFFFGDERNVPQDDKDSNYLMAKTALFDHVLTIDPDKIFAVDTSLEPAEAAEKYTEEIADFFGDEPMEFNLILLGLGDNSHTASLFPHTPVLHDTTTAVKSVYLEDQQVYRITFTAPLINNAHHIAFLVYGAGKAEAVHHVLEDPKDIENYPAQLIDPVHGEVHWFLDEAAAANIKHKS